MTAIQLGRLITVDAREVWKHEAHDFTPWLREHIDLLGEALGFDFEITAREAPIGDFKVDLLGRESNSGRSLIIENQLEATDHGHLGQLITYAAGLDAGMIIWITPQFREEHRQALAWLNAHTSEGIDFFGVEIELLRIGNSLPAPHFKLAAQPNDWAKTARSTVAAAGNPSAIDLRYRDFFQLILDEAKRRYPDLTSQLHVKTTWELTIHGGRPGFLFRWRRAAERKLAIELVLSDDHALDHFEALKARQEEIEAKLTFSLTWKLDGTLRRQIVGVQRQGNIDGSPDQSVELREWAVNTMIRMVEVLRPIIKELQPLNISAGGESEDEEPVLLPNGSRAGAGGS